MFLNTSNHPLETWSAAQRAAAEALGHGPISDLPGGLPLVPPELDEVDLARLADELTSRLLAAGARGAFVAGEYGLTVALVDRLRARGVRCYAATTRREATATAQADGSVVRESRFQFVRFREYGNLAGVAGPAPHEAGTPRLSSEAIPRGEAPLLYVCILSANNVAEYRAIKHLRPVRVIAVSSRRLAGSERSPRVDRLFRDALAAELGIAEVEIVGDSEGAGGHGGDDYAETLSWVRAALAPRLSRRIPGMRCALNVTGGTKATVLALADGYDGWDEWHYQSLSGGRLQRFVRGRAIGEESVGDDLSVREHLRLYISGHDRPTKAVGPRTASGAGSLALAEWYYAAVATPGHAGPAFVDGVLGPLWFRDQKKDDPRGVIREGDVARITEERIPATALSWIEPFLALDPDGIARRGEGELRIPVDRVAAGGDWRDWMTGGWWEQLVAAWVSEVVEDPRRVARGVYIGDVDEHHYEADVVAVVRGQVRILEAKAGRQTQPRKDGGLSSEWVAKLHHVATRVGLRAPAAFVVTPVFGEGDGPVGQRLREFERASAAAGIRILRGRDELKAWLSEG